MGPVTHNPASMRTIINLLAPLRRAGAAFFKHDLALRRDAAGLQIVMEARLEPEPKPKKKPKREAQEELALQKAKRDLALILEQLGVLLAEVPESRSALRHLVFVEAALQKKGLRALGKLPIAVLEKALEQLESLVTNWSPAGLASLRSKIAVAIMDRELADPIAVKAGAVAESVVDSMPPPPPDEDPEPDGSEEDALAAAYAALGDAGPSGSIEFHSELGSFSAKAMAPSLPRVTSSAEKLQLREVQT